MDTKTEVKKVYDVVKEILARDERARNCDKYLTFRVVEWFLYNSENLNGKVAALRYCIIMQLEDLKKLPAFETIKRVRARIQNTEDLYLPTDESVRKKRKQRQKEMRDLWR